MTLDAFAGFHLPALLEDEILYAQIYAQVEQARLHPQAPFRWWSLGPPGACAVESKGRPISLGRLDGPQCAAFAREMAGRDYLGIAGIGAAPRAFVEAAEPLGERFRLRMVMNVMELRRAPAFPGAAGFARAALPSDFDWLVESRLGFLRDLAPSDPPADLEGVVAMIRDRRHVIWMCDGERVSMATEARVLPGSVTVGGVYTPPAWRGRGFAGSAVASLCALAFAEGKRAISLWADVENPASNRCYEKIGFRALDLMTDYRRL